jgi:hypothetical protein
MGIEKLDLPDVLSLSLDGIQPQQAGDAGHSTEVGDIHVSLILALREMRPPAASLRRLLEDHQVDRRGVQVQQCTELTRTPSARAGAISGIDVRITPSG